MESEFEPQELLVTYSSDRQLFWWFGPNGLQGDMLASPDLTHDEALDIAEDIQQTYGAGLTLRFAVEV